MNKYTYPHGQTSDKHESLIWFSIERDTEDQLDDYPGSIYIIDFSVFGIKWNDGSHILSY